MTTLDCADSAQSTPQRNETLTALQALTMLNSKFSLTMAEYFAQRMESLSKEPSVQVAEAFELTTGRTPSPEELRMLETYRRGTWFDKHVSCPLQFERVGLCGLDDIGSHHPPKVSRYCLWLNCYREKSLTPEF